MALDYSTANTGIFYRGGKATKYVNAHQTMPQATLPAELKAIADPFEAADMTLQLGSLYSDVASWQNDQNTIRQRFAAIWDQILSDPVNVLPNLSLTSPGFNATYWDALWRVMLADVATINASVVTIGAIAAGSGNVGNGTILTTGVLDAYNAPVAGGPALAHYLNVTSELAVASETMTFEVVTDTGNGATSGQETLRWFGGISGPQLDWQYDGSGSGKTLQMAAGGGVLTDGDFDNWSSNTPTNWTITAGATQITHEVSTTYRSGSSLKMAGDGATAAMTITQDLTGKVNSGRRYCLSLYLKCSSAAPLAGDFTSVVSWVNQDGTTGSTTVISVGHAALTTSFALKSGFFALPLTSISSVTLTHSWSGTPTNTKNLFLDTCALQAVTYFGGIGAVAVCGSTDVTRGDRWTSAVSNSEGVFQQFLRRKYGVQLPSNNAAGETILDSLAT